MNIATREEFKCYIRMLFGRAEMADENSALWIPENDLNGVKCQWFVTAPCVRKAASVTKSDYWAWCADNLKGFVRCFMSNNEDDEEVWGFTELDDINWWMLKWT